MVPHPIGEASAVGDWDGTEVAYLLRVLLDRIGLTERPDQLRIIASSASLEAGGESLEDAFVRLVGAETQTGRLEWL